MFPGKGTNSVQRSHPLLRGTRCKQRNPLQIWRHHTSWAVYACSGRISGTTYQVLAEPVMASSGSLKLRHIRLTAHRATAEKKVWTVPGEELSLVR
jgi:hypothetical protein